MMPWAMHCKPSPPLYGKAGISFKFSGAGAEDGAPLKPM